ncbi:LPXTG cell wall anchor domain-containing protein [Streptococcus sobrinus]|uniref:LPXTG cell wall anchor domain-containing protein n=2 Tax=Streptococcus sobrinus TaxID=1310 RepID=UPI0002FBADCF|nr:LPXTG cell wall anchor domain-containing protein [Streptococcus sobrinus]
MTKKQVLTSVLVAGFALSSGGSAFADEVQSQSVQPQTSAATVVSQPAADNSTPTVPDSGQASTSDGQPAGGDVSQPSSSTPSSSETGDSSSQTGQSSPNDSAPASSDTPSVPDSGQTTPPSSGDQGTTAPSGDNAGVTTPDSSVPSSSTPDSSTSSSSDKDQSSQPQAAPDQSTPDVSGSNQESKPDSQSQSGDQSKSDSSDKGNQVSQSATPSDQPSAGQAYDQGQSQVGLTSDVTGQTVQDVTPETPVTTENGSTIVSVQNGQPIVSQVDGTTQAVDPGAVGATVNSDKTLSVKGDDGKMKTLPHTGDGSSSAVMASGLAMVLSAVLLFLKTKFNFFAKKN